MYAIITRNLACFKNILMTLIKRIKKMFKQKEKKAEQIILVRRAFFSFVDYKYSISFSFFASRASRHRSQ